MKIAIVGAGIGGLTLSVALKRKGIDSQLFEVANEIKAVGAGIWMPPNAMNILDQLGVGERIRSSGYELSQIDVRDYKNKLISRIDGDWLLNQYNSKSISIERTALHKALADSLDVGQILTGVRCEGVDQNSSGVTLKTIITNNTIKTNNTTDTSNTIQTIDTSNTNKASGTNKKADSIINTSDAQLNFDCVIGADGIHSIVRQSLFPQRKLRYTGQTCFRGLIEHDSIPELFGGSVELWGNGSRFGLSPVGNKKYYWYSTLLKDAGLIFKKDEAAKLLMKEFENFPNYIKSIISSIEKNPNGIIHTDLFDLTPDDHWVQNKIALLGDAAHATTPNLGQGAAMVIEDAYVLAEELTSTNNPDEAFINYNQKRKKRVNFIVNTSWKIGKMATTTNPILNNFRNHTMRVLPKLILQKQLDQVYKSGLL